MNGAALSPQNVTQVGLQSSKECRPTWHGRSRSGPNPVLPSDPHLHGCAGGRIPFLPWYYCHVEPAGVFVSFSYMVRT